MPERTLRATIMRGGTSRAVFLDAAEIPTTTERDALLLRLMGSPDPRQIDGLGGADLLTSKVAIIGQSADPNADVEYTFAQVGIDRAFVDYHVNCGNISAAVALYAAEEGLVTVPSNEADDCVVRIHNTNTNTFFSGTFNVHRGRLERSESRIENIHDSGAVISMDYSGTAGAVTGRMLPGGGVRQTLEVISIGPVEVTILDFGCLIVYVAPKTLGLQGDESPEWFTSRPEIMAGIESLRGAAAVASGLATSADSAYRESPIAPLVAIVSEPKTYHALGGADIIDASEMDLCGRIFAGQAPHKAYAGTGLANLGVAAALPGTLVNELIDKSILESSRVRVGHPCGTAVVDIIAEGAGPTFRVSNVGYIRSARRIMTGTAFI